MSKPTLDDIITHKRDEVALLKERLKRTGSTTVLRTLTDLRSLEAVVGADGFTIIPELKAADPWRGVFRERYDVTELARTFEQAHAPALAVQTDERFFNGSYDDLLHATRRTTVPILMRDFVVDEAQLTHAKATGADAAVLFAQLLTEDEIRRLLDFARLIMLEMIVEVTDTEGLEKALATDVKMIGVQNRDVRSQTVKLERAPRLRELIPTGRLAIAIGGAQSATDLRRVREAGFDAAIVGEVLMRADDPAGAYTGLVKAVNEPADG